MNIISEKLDQMIHQADELLLAFRSLAYPNIPTNIETLLNQISDDEKKVIESLTNDLKKITDETLEAYFDNDNKEIYRDNNNTIFCSFDSFDNFKKFTISLSLRNEYKPLIEQLLKEGCGSSVFEGYKNNNPYEYYALMYINDGKTDYFKILKEMMKLYKPTPNDLVINIAKKTNNLVSKVDDPFVSNNPRVIDVIKYILENSFQDITNLDKIAGRIFVRLCKQNINFYLGNNLDCYKKQTYLDYINNNPALSRLRDFLKDSSDISDINKEVDQSFIFDSSNSLLKIPKEEYLQVPINEERIFPIYVFDSDDNYVLNITLSGNKSFSIMDLSLTPIPQNIIKNIRTNLEKIFS